jgi:hypothetical protein
MKAVTSVLFALIACSAASDAFAGREGGAASATTFVDGSLRHVFNIRLHRGRSRPAFPLRVTVTRTSTS